MKSIFEIKEMRDRINLVSRTNPFSLVEIQALEWSRRIMQADPLHAKDTIIKRIWRLEEKQVEPEMMDFAMKPARAAQINALKWVVDEYDLDVVGPV